MSYRLANLTLSIVRDGSVQADTRRMESPADAAGICVASQPDDGREHFRIALLDIRRKVLGVHTVSIGTLSSSLVHPREVFRPAILAGAAALVVTHNHPSGDPEPSAEDLALTRRLQTAGQMIGIEILDHVITGNGSARWVSLKERGAL